MSTQQETQQNQNEIKYTTDFNEVKEKELDEILMRRQLMYPFIIGKGKYDKKNDQIENDLVGLCLSGGGIRSATFNLGVIQALFRSGRLRFVDYLSTVSGGGYIGSCLTSLLNSHIDKFKVINAKQSNIPEKKNSNENSRLKPEDLWKEENFPFELKCKNRNAQQDEDKFKKKLGEYEYADDKAPAKWLRYFSNYLTAEGGYIKPALIYLRGLLLNILKILPYIILLAFILFLIFNFESFLKLKSSWLSIQKIKYWDNNFYIYFLIFVIGWSVIWTRFDQLFRSSYSVRRIFNKIYALPVISILIFIALRFYGLFIVHFAKYEDWYWFVLLCLVLLPMILLIIRKYIAKRESTKKFFITISSVFFLSIAPITIFYLTSSFVQILNLKFYDSSRVEAEPTHATLSLTKIKITAHEIKIIQDSVQTETGKAESPKNPMLVGAVAKLFENNVDKIYSFLDETFIKGINKELPFHFKLLIIMIVLWFFTDKFIDINNISLHKFYRDSLSKAYLIQNSSLEGKIYSQVMHKDRQKLSELYKEKINDNLITTIGPYHILNTTLNLSKKLPLQQDKFSRFRKSVRNIVSNKLNDESNSVFRTGESFIFSKKWCGSEKTGYIRTEKLEAEDKHLDLATAMAISGAAVNVSMADKTISNLKFLFSLFNIRLGYWIINPAKVCMFPNRGFFYKIYFLFRRYLAGWTIIREWLGGYSTNDFYLNLSDGGHFDNLGAYELLKRRCKYIIVSDSEADPQMRFQGLSYLIRVARIDLGIQIDINTHDIRIDDETGKSKSHCAIGTIKYPNTETGYLLYIKSSITGDEPEHLNEYRTKEPTFPHQTTADQWFDEQQFEVYRELGYHIAKEVLQPIKEFVSGGLEDDFITLKQAWYPRSKKTEQFFIRHSTELNKIYKEIKNDPEIEYLDNQFYPQWDRISKYASNEKWLPDSPRKIRKGFYICSMMIHLMENVYMDLDLETQYMHPDNRGWINEFRNWSQSNMFKLTWAIIASTCGLRFISFSKKMFGLRVLDEIKPRGEVVEDKTNGAEFKENIIWKDLLEKDELNEDTNMEKILKVMVELKDINPVEYRRIKQIILDKNVKFNKLIRFKFRIYNTFELEVKESNSIEFDFAFALLNKEELVYLRVQNQLRGMGLGRQALKLLVREYNVKKINEDGRSAITDIKHLEGSIKSYHQYLPQFERMLKSVVTEMSYT